MIKAIIFVLFVSFCLALDFPKNFLAGSGSTRGDQQQVTNFAVWNSTSNSWNVAIPHGASGVNAIVAVGNGLLAVGSMTSFVGGSCAGILFYDGKVWSAPEGVGLYSYTASNTLSRFENPTTGFGSARTATVVGNDVYILGTFNQVGLVRYGVNNFVKLTWNPGNVFTIGTVGNGYFETISSDCTSFCPTTPAFTNPIKFTSYTSSTSQLTFVLLTGSNLYTFVPDSAQWNQINAGSSARNLLGNIADFDIFNAVIYVVGKFDNTNDAVPANQYLHIAKSSDNGNSWQALSSPQPLNAANFATLSPVVDPLTQLTTFVGLNAVGLTSIFVESDQSIYVAGGWRTTERNVTLDNLAGQMQTRVFQIVGSTLTILSERFANKNSYTGLAPEFNGPTIYKLVKYNNVLYAYGDFHNYRQVVPFVGARFGTRYTEVIKGAAAYVNSTWIQAHGGFLTPTFSDSNAAVTLVTSNNLFYFIGTFANSYNLVSGSVFGFGGDFTNLEKNRWNSVLGNARFVSAQSFVNGIGQEGEVKSLHLTKDGNALIIGGQFDWIGSQRIGGVAWYNPRSRTVDQVGGGLYQTNNLFAYGADSFYNNRIGGIVYDFEERDDYLYAGGVFNRNNSGNALYNIAQLRFKTKGAGWEQLDGGCDGRVRDLLVVGDLLYITGSFRSCGLVNDQYTGDLTRGRVPASRIAVINLAESKKSWRNLGIGLSNDGYALASRGSDLFVGGIFDDAGGKLYTDGIARWRGDHWENVVAKCRGNCDRDNNIYPYISNSVVPSPTERKPVTCVNLRRYHGNIYCMDTGNNVLSYFDANTWYQAGSLGVNAFTTVESNTLIGRNASNMDYIMVSGTGGNRANGENLLQYSENVDNFVPSYTGFSTTVKSLSTASTMFSSSLIIFSIVILFVSKFF